ncbi:unnamed protein product [Adineta steineri]|uniref:JmjC domain-containing protein n=2 Tax=Adineta steineri TaxID=433720 RepID=A0A813RHQ5_9BILA|nr:unnamed protein product [Adineta steineri]
MHEGSPKFWYIVPPSHADQLERCLRDVDILDTSHCQASLRHKTLFPNPFELAQLHNIPVYRIEQCPNEIIVIFPRAYNWGFDGGFNVTESINFALPSWIPIGRSARSCLCQRVGNPVELDMDPFTEENVLTYTQTYLNNQLPELDHILMESDKQPILDLELVTSNVQAAMFTYLSSEETDALMDDDFSIYFSVSPPQTTSVVAYTAENEQPLLSLSTSRTTKSTEELPFDHCTSLEIGSIILRQDEIAAETARIRRKWVEEKDTLMARLVVDITKPEIGSIYQWETLVNSDDVVLDDYLPENISNFFQGNKKFVMASRRFCLWFVLMIITQSVGEDMRSVRMSLMRNSKFQCANTTCVPFINFVTRTILNCQAGCLAVIQCATASFHRSTSNCELFTDMLNQNGNMLFDADIISMNVIAETRSPPG